MEIEPVHVIPGKIPDDYHCRCRYCMKAIGELRREDGSNYSRLERREYYSDIERGEGGHIAKTPLHIARWAVQEYTSPGDWVLDPTAGAGTTLVEALIQGRNAAGMELEYGNIIAANVEKHAHGVQAKIRVGDARGIGQYLPEIGKWFKLVVNNPPYFGDQSFPGPSPNGLGKEHRATEKTYFYDKNLPNLAFLKEGPEYWDTISGIYKDCIQWLSPGGYFVIGVKDQMRQKKPDQLHEKFARVLTTLGLQHVGTAFLLHYPGTLHLHTYEKRWGAAPPKYQSIVVFRKEVKM